MSPANSLSGVQKPADDGTRRRDLPERKAAAEAGFLVRLPMVEVIPYGVHRQSGYVASITRRRAELAGLLWVLSKTTLSGTLPRS